MTPEYTKKLIELAEELEQELIGFGFDPEYAGVASKAHHLIGFIQALKETE